jgi:hypothetical protein
VNGINELVRNYTADAEDITSPTGQQLALELLDHIRARMVQMQEDTGHLYNLEATPAEGTTYRFAREDRKRFADILQAGPADKPYYTNSSQLPAGHTDDPFWPATSGAAAAPLYRRHRVAPVHDRGGQLRRSLQATGAPLAAALPPALHHGDAHFLGLPAARLPERSSRILPQVRCRTAGPRYGSHCARRLLSANASTSTGEQYVIPSSS